MAQIQPGERILVPVSVSNGPFPNERLITFEGMDGPISGFIKADQIKPGEDGSFIDAVVLEVEEKALLVRLHGSFFTTTGQAYMSPQTKFLRAA
jgi:hypothetical protein